LHLPKKIDGLTCDIVQTGRVRSSQGGFVPWEPQDPLCPGSEIGVLGGEPGTLGGFGTDGSGQVYLVTNCHVVSPNGSDVTGTEVYQPAPGHAGSRPIARVTKMAAITTTGRNDVDVAIARLKTGIGYDPAIPGIGRVSGLKELQPGAAVCKVGERTHYTDGNFESLDVDVTVDFNGIVATFAEVLAFIPSSFGQEGDSGSFVVDSADNALVGLFFGVSANRSFAIPIGKIDSELGGLNWL
jgi:hypothetical protein